MKDLLLIGGGGHASSCLDIIRLEAKWKVVRLIEKEKYSGPLMAQNLIIGEDRDLGDFIHQTSSIHISVGQIASHHMREAFYIKASELGANFPVIRSPLSYVSEKSEIGEGSILMHGSLVNFGAVVGKQCIVNTRSVVEHDAIIGDFCHVSTGAIINGGVSVGRGSFIGSGAVIREGVTIGPESVIGAGVTVMKDVPFGTVIRGGAK